MIIESGGDNLTATFSRGLVDAQIFVLDVSGGDKVPRKGGPGVSRSDLLVINKTDLAGQVGADLSVMARDAGRSGAAGAVIFSSLREDPGAPEVSDWVRALVRARSAGRAPAPRPPLRGDSPDGRAGPGGGGHPGGRQRPDPRHRAAL